MNRYALSQVLDKSKNNLQVGVKSLYVLHPSDLYSIAFDSNNDVSMFLVKTDKYLQKIQSENSAANITISDSSFEVDLDFLGVSTYYENAIKALLKQDYFFVFAEMFNGEIVIGGVQIDKTLPFARYKLSKIQFKKEQRSGLSSDTNNTNKSKIQFSCANKDTVFLSGLTAHLIVNSADYKKAMFTRDASGTISSATIQGVSYANYGSGLIAQANISNASLSVGTANAIFGNITDLRFYSAALKTIEVTELTNLNTLLVYSNSLTEINVSTLINLAVFYCFSNQLTELNVTNNVNITYLLCNNNQLTALVVLNLSDLIYLMCYSNSIDELDLTNSTDLETLGCQSNSLDELDVSNCTKIVYLHCGNNQLSTTQLNNILSDLDTHGKLNGTLNITNNAGTHTNTTAYNNLIAKGWTITT